MNLRYASPAVGTVVEAFSLRRPERMLRVTKWANVIIDYRLMSASFRYRAPASRLNALVLLEGRAQIEDLRLSPGDAVLFDPQRMTRSRWENAVMLGLEWRCAKGEDDARPKLIDRPSLPRMLAIARALEDESRAQLPLFEEAISEYRALGAPIDLGAMEGEPSERDRRIARAMERQLANLSTEATTLHLGEDASLSPRQLQRTIHEFNDRYSINAGNWRDMRNRWRIQIGSALLSIPTLSLAEVAREVGYSSPSLFSRALANLGLPTCEALRERLLADRL